VPVISSNEDTIIYLYSDNDKADNTTYVGDVGDTPAKSVWDDNFVGVWHMGQDPTGGNNCIKDSTSNANHGTPGGTMTTGDLVDGKVGKALDFDGTDDSINCGNSSAFNPGTGSFTVEQILKLVNVSTRQAIIGKQNQSVDYDGWTFRVSQTGADGKIHLTLREDGSHYITRRGSSVLQNATEYNAAFTYDGSETAAGILFYVDGSRETEVTEVDTLATTVTSSVNLHIASAGDTGSNFTGGVIDETRISNTDRSASWIKATYYSNWDQLIIYEQQKYYFAGYTLEDMEPVSRVVRVYSSSNGRLVGETTSSGTTGYYKVWVNDGNNHYLVCMDAEALPDYNNIIVSKATPYEA
jgi:hypothetical protein